MWPLTGLLFLGVLIIIERFFTIFRAQTKTNEFMHLVRSCVLEGKNEEAVATCEKYHGSVPRVVKVALLRREQGMNREELEKVTENAAIKEVAHLERFLWLLAMISNVAPILGFLGTVVGMIQSFEVLAREGMNNPGAVAEGISVALITTAGGLIVAIIVLPFYNWFTARIGGFTNEIETAGNFLLETLEEAADLGVAKKSRA
jgi:biopolymer transport protein ExbB